MVARAIIGGTVKPGTELVIDADQENNLYIM